MTDRLMTLKDHAIGRGIVDLADWAFCRDLERLCRAAGMRVVGEMLMEYAGTTLTRTELEGVIRRYLVAYCLPEARK